MKPTALIRLLRIPHWIKNLIVLLPLIFARRLAEPWAWSHALLGTLSFCLASSFIYVLNDLLDQERDRHHPDKKNRPIATGQVSFHQAVLLMGGLLLLLLLLAPRVGPRFVWVVTSYLGLQLLYNFLLKRWILADVISLAIGFVLRAVGGAVAIDAIISPWLVICTFSICLFLGFGKRSCEQIALGDRAAKNHHREVLAHYTTGLLTHLLTLSASIAIVSFLLYATSPRTIAEFGTHLFIFTLPFIFYGVFRYAMLCMQGAYSGPTELLLRDRPLQLTILLWLAVTVWIIYQGADIERWLAPYVQR